jgi:hypothetical protein
VISLLIKIQASYLKHKVSIFAPGVPENMDTFEQKKYFVTLKNIPITSIFSGTPGTKMETLCFKYEACIFIRREITGKILKRLMYFFYYIYARAQTPH